MQQLLAVADELADKGTALGKGTTAKAWAVQHILHSCEKRKEKLVIFSQYLMDLDELEHVLQQVSQAYMCALSLTGSAFLTGFCFRNTTSELAFAPTWLCLMKYPAPLLPQTPSHSSPSSP